MTDFVPPEAVIPHRPPFLFLDRVVELEPGVRARGQWDITGEEAFFAGHFPGRPTLPGVLMTEALAQLGAYTVLVTDAYTNKVPLFGGLDKARFRRQVVPGECLDLRVEVDRLSARAGKATGQAFVDDQLACSCQMMFVAVDV